MRELADLRKQIETVRRSVSRQRNSGVQKLPEFEALYERLIAADFSDEIADELVQSVAARAPSANEDIRRNSDKHSLVTERLCSTLRDELEERFRVSPELGASDLEHRVVAFVGPSGAGKTTSLVKLALAYGVAARTPLQIFSTDTLRVGGAEQLGAYARIMGVSFQAVPTMATLEQALQECRAKKLILIDTPGYGSAEMDEARELKSFLNRNAHIEVQLVIPATLRPTAVASVLGRFATFRPSKILFTHLDDAQMPGTVIDAAIRCGLPISFLAAGQQIPQDIQEASKKRLMDKLFDHVAEAAVAAA